MRDRASAHAHLTLRPSKGFNPCTGRPCAQPRGRKASSQRALYKNEGGRRITDPGASPLFPSEAGGDDLESGTIYVLRSKSTHPDVAAHRDLIHKVGVTSGLVETRIAQAATDATYLRADVEVVATYTLFNINRVKLENLLHRVFASARLGKLAAPYDIEVEADLAGVLPALDEG